MSGSTPEPDIEDEFADVDGDPHTLEYLRERFTDYYQSTTLDPPPDTEHREWGAVPWDANTIHRHRLASTGIDLNKLATFHTPMHLYHSTAYYDVPDAEPMDTKGWRGADLVFDIDGDHLPGVDAENQSHAAILAAAKDETLALLDFLERDFGFDNIEIVFSGNRGYHVHVRDESVRSLGSQQRERILSYLDGEKIRDDPFIACERDGSIPSDTLMTGGWGRRLAEQFDTFATDLTSTNEETAVDMLQTFDGIGETRAESVYRTITAQRENDERWSLANASVATVATHLAENVAVHVDEPVTSDTKRLIRAPGSLHGGSGLRVTRVPRDEFASFEPLHDAVPDIWEDGAPIPVTILEDIAYTLAGQSPAYEQGEYTIPAEHAIYLMARGIAEVRT